MARSPTRRARPTIPPATPPAIAVEFDFEVVVSVDTEVDVSVDVKMGVLVDFEADLLVTGVGWPTIVAVGALLGTKVPVPKSILTGDEDG